MSLNYQQDLTTQTFLHETYIMLILTFIISLQQDTSLKSPGLPLLTAYPVHTGQKWREQDQTILVQIRPDFILQGGRSHKDLKQ